jgi:hypothetical protein
MRPAGAVPGGIGRVDRDGDLRPQAMLEKV